MLPPPWLVISASATPEASTRWRMIEIAWLMTSGVTVSLPSVTGVRMICVPPSRSSASLGVQVASDQVTPAKRMANMTTAAVPNVMSVRTGRYPRVGVATVVSFGRSGLVSRRGQGLSRRPGVEGLSSSFSDETAASGVSSSSSTGGS